MEMNRCTFKFTFSYFNFLHVLLANKAADLFTALKYGTIKTTRSSLLFMMRNITQIESMTIKNLKETTKQRHA